MYNNCKKLKDDVIRNFGRKKMIGTSKRQIRQQIFEETGVYKESPYIHGIVTFDTYVKCGLKYVEWLASEHPNVHNLKYALKMGYAREYIQTLIDRSLSASTIARATSALAKLYGVTANDIHDSSFQCSYEAAAVCFGSTMRDRAYQHAWYFLRLQSLW